MHKNMIKVSIYILLITILSACSNFSGTDDDVIIDKRGNTKKKSDRILTSEELYSTTKSEIKREQYDIIIEKYKFQNISAVSF